MPTERISKEKLRKLQLAELDVFKTIKKICEENGLRYYLSSGTLLGAVRHGGFIPWDDDMDICMPRSDYISFRDIAMHQLSEPFSCIDYRNLDTNDPQAAVMLKIISKKVKAVRLRGDGSMQTIDNAWVDVFPLDGLPDGKFQRRCHCYRLQARRWLYRLAIYRNIGIPQIETPVKNFTARLIRFFHVPQLLRLDPLTQRDKLNRLLQTYSFETSKYCINFLGDYGLKEICPTAMYGTPKSMSFEEIVVAVPEDADGILKIIYGDYKKLPRKEEQICKHCIEVIEETL